MKLSTSFSMSTTYTLSQISMFHRSSLSMWTVFNLDGNFSNFLRRSTRWSIDKNSDNTTWSTFNQSKEYSSIYIPSNSFFHESFGTLDFSRCNDLVATHITWVKEQHYMYGYKSYVIIACWRMWGQGTFDILEVCESATDEVCRRPRTTPWAIHKTISRKVISSNVLLGPLTLCHYYNTYKEMCSSWCFTNFILLLKEF